MLLKFEIYATKLDRNIPVHLYLPDQYMDLSRDYPVLYMFDGMNLFQDEDASFGRSWRLMNYVGKNGNPDMIIVGIESSRVGDNRLIEYAPYPFYDPEFKKAFDARGDQTMDFILHDLKPYIDAHFPTRKDRTNTWIGGSSCGGLMAYYAGIQYSKYFSKSLVISPYFTPSQSNLMVLTARTFLKKPASFYFSWGAREGVHAHEFVQETQAVTSLASILLRKGCKVQFNVKVYGEHNEASWESEADEFLRFLEQ